MEGGANLPTPLLKYNFNDAANLGKDSSTHAADLTNNYPQMITYEPNGLFGGAAQFMVDGFQNSSIISPCKWKDAPFCSGRLTSPGLTFGDWGADAKTNVQSPAVLQPFPSLGTISFWFKSVEDFSSTTALTPVCGAGQQWNRHNAHFFGMGGFLLSTGSGTAVNGVGLGMRCEYWVHNTKKHGVQLTDHCYHYGMDLSFDKYLDGSWHHMAMTIDDPKIDQVRATGKQGSRDGQISSKLFVDGVMVQHRDKRGTAWDCPIHGRTDSWEPYAFTIGSWLRNILMDDFTIWDSILSDEEILSIFKSAP